MEKWLIYVREALTEATHAAECYARYEEALVARDTSNIFLHIHHVIVHIANVDKILCPKPNSPRAELLAGHVDLTEIDLKLFRRLRNHLEHFDERLDMWVSNYDGKPFFDKNIVTGTRGFPSKAYLRALDGNVFKLHGEDYPLLSIRKLLASVIDMLKASDPHDA